MQRWSPRGHGLGLEAPRGQLVMSLALALASENIIIIIIIIYLLSNQIKIHVQQKVYMSKTCQAHLSTYDSL